MLGVEQERAEMGATGHMIDAVRALALFFRQRISRRAAASTRISASGQSLWGRSSSRFTLGPFSFLLHDYFVEAWAANATMHVLVDDARVPRPPHDTALGLA
jgi:hypothetical protein